MEFNFTEYFYTDKYDNEIIIKNNLKNFSVSEIKKLVCGEASFLKSLKKENIIIEAEDNFDFIVIFLSCILAKKNIVISNSNNKNHKEEIENSYKLSKITETDNKNFEFEKIDLNKIKLTIYTSGTTSKPKATEKSIESVVKESFDTISILNLNKKAEFITTTPINHMYAITAYLFTPLNSKNIINTDRIEYPESLNIRNSVLITSPSFLTQIKKHNIKPPINPDVILSAGAKLTDEVQKYIENFSKIINLYGCSETGFIAYKETSDRKNFKLFKGIKILSSNKDKTVVASEYSDGKEIILDDLITLNPDGTIEVSGRKDRVFKIQEKRVSAAEIEKNLLENDFINDCALINLGDKIGAIAALSQKGIDFLMNKNMPDLIKKLKSDLSKEFSIIPQRWKFIDKIPVNDLGKIDTEKITDIFSMNLSLPVAIKRKEEKEYAEFELYFYKNCNFYKGHFEHFPITAGVVQLYFAYYFSKTAFGEKAKNCHIGQIKRVKFSNIIHPDSIVKLKLTKNEKSINFEYCSEETSYSSGCLPLNGFVQGE